MTTPEQRRQREWIVGVLGIATSLAIASVITWGGSDGGARVGDWPVFVICAIIAFGVQWLMFVHAWSNQTELYYDLTGGVTYIVMVITALLLSGASDLRSLLIVALIMIWALRLAPFLYVRTKQAGEDRRFRSIKTSFPTYLMTWTLQGTWVLVTASCALAAITSSLRVGVDAALVAGLALWIFGFAIEVVADRQKTAFRANPDNANRFITTGLWAWSRHPNYFGEIVLWLGIAVISYPALVGWQVVTLVSPLLVVLLLTAVSGVRMLEERGEKAWGEDPDYQAYKRNTPVLMLWPPKARS